MAAPIRSVSESPAPAGTVPTEPAAARFVRLPGWVWLAALTVLAVALRSLRLTWQPLWWDEGYSVFFATESLARMAELTARDIHPPLYYGLLHLWIRLWGGADPTVLRSFSVLIGGLSVPGIWWVGRMVYPHRPRIALVAALLLAVSPMHLFYSQEVRMYGLELLLGLLSTGFFAMLWRARTPAERRRAILAYGLITAAALYTEYYVALLPLAHFLWAVGKRWRTPRTLLPLVAADMLAALLFLPWLLFTVPHLFAYVQAKVIADNDAPLSLLSYIGRHLVAFGGGHLSGTGLGWLRYAGVAGIVLAFGLDELQDYLTGRRGRPRVNPDSGVTSFLAWGVILPALMGYGLNRLWPFFPEGGERVLFFLLPGLLLFVVEALDRLWSEAMPTRWGGAAAFLLLLIGAGAGVTAFYTVPRYVDDDYRPLIRHVTQQGTDADTVLAVFPWQVGFWRAYGPVFTPGGDPALGLAPGTDARHGPWPQLLSFDAVAWDEDVAAQLDASLSAGVMWLPSLLSIGSTLPQEMEAYLAPVALNVENRWFSPTTRLSAWTRPQPVARIGMDADFGPVRLLGGGAAPLSAASANQVIQVDLVWTGPEAAEPFLASLRLQDSLGHTWAERDFGPLAVAGPSQADPSQGGLNRIGLMVPPGLPPGRYQVRAGVRPMSGLGQIQAQTQMDDGQPVPDLLTLAGGTDPLITLAEVTITPPQEPVPALRLPVQHPLAAPVAHGSLLLLGYAGPDPTQPVLAGTAVDLTLFWQGGAELAFVDREPPGEFYLAVMDGGSNVVWWSGWSAWAEGPAAVGPGDLAQAPLTVQVPGYVQSGRYDLVAGLILADRSLTAGTTIGQLAVVQRTASFAPVTPAHVLDPPMQVGTHALLLGYDLTMTPADQADLLELTLVWQVEQPLLPAHHLFVHVEDASGARLAQSDAVPSNQGDPAPTGSWQPGEILVHRQEIRVPRGESLAGAEADGAEADGAEADGARADGAEADGVVVRVGLYVPETGVRLPVSQAGLLLGDNIPLPLIH